MPWPLTAITFGKVDIGAYFSFNTDVAIRDKTIPRGATFQKVASQVAAHPLGSVEIKNANAEVRKYAIGIIPLIAMRDGWFEIQPEDIGSRRATHPQPILAKIDPVQSPSGSIARSSQTGEVARMIDILVADVGRNSGVTDKTMVRPIATENRTLLSIGPSEACMINVYGHRWMTFAKLGYRNLMVKTNWEYTDPPWAFPPDTPVVYSNEITRRWCARVLGSGDSTTQGYLMSVVERAQRLPRETVESIHQTDQDHRSQYQASRPPVAEQWMLDADRLIRAARPTSPPPPRRSDDGYRQRIGRLNRQIEAPRPDPKPSHNKQPPAPPTQPPKRIINLEQDDSQ